MVLDKVAGSCFIVVGYDGAWKVRDEELSLWDRRSYFERRNLTRAGTNAPCPVPLKHRAFVDKLPTNAPRYARSALRVALFSSL